MRRRFSFCSKLATTVKKLYYNRVCRIYNRCFIIFYNVLEYFFKPMESKGNLYVITVTPLQSLPGTSRTAAKLPEYFLVLPCVRKKSWV